MNIFSSYKDPNHLKYKLKKITKDRFILYSHLGLGDQIILNGTDSDGTDANALLLQNVDEGDGQIVFDGKISSYSNQSIDLSKFSKGVYLIEFTNSKQTYSKKIVIE